MAGKLMTGSICLSDVNEQAKKAHSAFSRSDKNKKIYVNVKVWINEEADNYGNHASVQLNPKKDMETENIYIGHLKNVERKEAEPLKQDDTKDIPTAEELDDPPFRL